jgi:hypothetical protein
MSDDSQFEDLTDYEESNLSKGIDSTSEVKRLIKEFYNVWGGYDDYYKRLLSLLNKTLN